ncbi:DoxX family protein [Tardiphaga robiniae]|uniref:DoxX family membrane protein n=1 Tax=Tardiphaga robiniae TaxID=943830 RepID=A0A7G6U1F5_9BRAD|nr:DoxX family protein [Tardiphaga robiniae]QND72837.1 DoxX family membrane protein [Tardiphaga robiniae]
MTSSQTTVPGKGRNIASWILRVLLAAAFLGAGGAKLAGVPLMIQVFDQIGVGQWFRYVTALVEISCAIALFVPVLTAPAALLLGVTTFFALLTHLFILHTSPAPAVVLLVLSFVLAWLQRHRLPQVLKTVL